MSGRLFTEDFLREGITETGAWKTLSDEIAADFRARFSALFEDFDTQGDPNEQNTKERLIYKALESLGWPERLPEERLASRGREDVPDGILFLSKEARRRAEEGSSAEQRYKHGTAVFEAKKWTVRLDKRLGDRTEAPSTQMLRYLSRAETMSDRAVLWGVLTNGRNWRLYFQGAKSRSEEFLDIDLPVLLGVKGIEPDLFSPPKEERDHWLRVFLLFFRREAFEKGGDGRTFHQLALDQGRFWEAKVREDLSDTVFSEVFPGFVAALAAADPEAPKELSPAYLHEARDAALTLLYRLLFALYAEDRNLLPRDDPAYDDYGLQKKVRADIAGRIDNRDALSDRRTTYFDHIAGLFQTIDRGDETIGVPPYNGGLFENSRSALLDRARLPDKSFAPLFDRLSRVNQDGRPQRINYRDLSVRQLGAIYERLLEFEPVAQDGRIVIRPNIYARKGSGSYYTPDELVDLIIQRTVGPLVEERLDAFVKKAEALKSDPRRKDIRAAELASLDPATAILNLKVCDPAMGSGHFLVALIDYLSDKALEAMATATAQWEGYRSPLGPQIEAIRARILAEAKKHRWRIREDQLEDRMIVRRMALKRCVYGVDRNPMAVELAKVSLWLHSFTAGAPLSFLDHHLRCGDSLFGEWVRPMLQELHKRGDFFADQFVAQAQRTALGMTEIETLTDADIAEAERSASLFEQIDEETSSLRALLDVRHACLWLGTKGEEAWYALIAGQFGDPIAAIELARQRPDAMKASRTESNESEKHRLAQQQKAAKAKKVVSAQDMEAIRAALISARSVADEERFFHWQVAFPGVWKDWESAANDGRGRGGFDAVIGNPPWDRMKMQEVEWFAARRPEIALAQRAADRKKMVAGLKEANDPLSDDYEKARLRAESAMDVARKGGQFPLLSQGDINIYSLFVERAQALIAPRGVIGLLVPVGIAYDKTMAPFFSALSGAHRVSTLIVFENKNGWLFKGVHHEDKPTVFVTSGPLRSYENIDCAFFLDSLEQLDDPSKRFRLTADAFLAINPNTGTAPLFRTHRDAQIVARIYQGHDVLIKRQNNKIIRRTCPIKYLRMFDMTNDSANFFTKTQLNEDGAYPIKGSRYQKGKITWLPLLEGKSIDQFNCRYASIRTSASGVSGQGVSIESPVADLKSPDFFPTPRFWVRSAAVDEIIPSDLSWMLSFRDTTNVNNWRSVIACLIPRIAAGNKLPLYVPIDDQNQSEWAPFLCANLNAFVLDYVARMKIQSRNLNAYIAEQLPIVSMESYSTLHAKLIKHHVLHLTYTAHDMAPFARDMGYEGPPFIWDETERMHLRARLDALYFILYGVTDRDDVRHIMSTFPIVREKDEKEHGFYLTEELILAYMNALEAGDAETSIDVAALKRAAAN